MDSLCRSLLLNLTKVHRYTGKPWPGQGIIAHRISYYLYVLTLTWSVSWSSLHDDVDFPMMRLLQSLRFAL